MSATLPMLLCAERLSSRLKDPSLRPRHLAAAAAAKSPLSVLNPVRLPQTCSPPELPALGLRQLVI